MQSELNLNLRTCNNNKKTLYKKTHCFKGTVILSNKKKDN